METDNPTEQIGKTNTNPALENIENSNNDQNLQMSESSFEQFTGQYIQDHIQELNQKKQELLNEQEQKIKAIKEHYSLRLRELDESLQLLSNISANLQTENEKTETKPSYKIKQQTLQDNEILLDLSSINLPFEFTPTVPFKLVEFLLFKYSLFQKFKDSCNKYNFKQVKIEGDEVDDDDSKVYEPKNSDQYLKMNIQQQLDLGRFTPFVFQPNLKQ